MRRFIITPLFVVAASFVLASPAFAQQHRNSRGHDRPDHVQSDSSHNSGRGHNDRSDHGRQDRDHHGHLSNTGRHSNGADGLREIRRIEQQLREAEHQLNGFDVYEVRAQLDRARDAIASARRTEQRNGPISSLRRSLADAERHIRSAHVAADNAVRTVSRLREDAHDHLRRAERALSSTWCDVTSSIVARAERQLEQGERAFNRRDIGAAEAAYRRSVDLADEAISRLEHLRLERRRYERSDSGFHGRISALESHLAAAGHAATRRGDSHTQRLVLRAERSLHDAEGYASRGQYQRAEIELSQAENYVRIVDARLESFTGLHREQVARR